MLWYNIKLSLRRFNRNRNTFLINLVGLTTGLACTLLIYIWIVDELKIDRFHASNERLYQVLLNQKEGDKLRTFESTPGLLASKLREEMPEVEYAAELIGEDWFFSKGIVTAGEQQLKADGRFVGEDYFKMFSWEILEGDPLALSQDKQAVMLSDEFARKLFGRTIDLVGQTIEWEQNRFDGAYQVVGVFKRPDPAQSTQQFDMVLSYDLFADQYRDNLNNWLNSNPITYLTLKEGINKEQFEQKLANVIPDEVRKLDNGEELLKYAGTLIMQPYGDRYLYNQYESGKLTGGRIAYVRLFGLIALFILVIACINFMNLSTARASTRMKEIGVKKVFGVKQQALVYQYMTEAMLLAFLGFFIALAIVYPFMPQFNLITGKDLSLTLDANLLLGGLAITALAGLLAGSYPALYLASLRPISVLKGKLPNSFGEVWTRKGLVVFQFFVSTLLIIAVTVVYSQIQYIQSKSLGLNKENVLTFERDGKLREDIGAFLEEVRGLGGVVEASNMSNNFTGEFGSTSGVAWEGKEEEARIQFGALAVDYRAIETMGIELLEGRSFDPSFGADSSKVIFNQAAIAAMGLENPLGQTIRLWNRPLEIVGVVKNFHYESMYETIKPCLFFLQPNERNILVRIKANEEQATISQIAALYEQFNPNLPFEYQFLNDQYQELYVAEQRVAALSQYMAGIAILISCLGLLGLIVFTAERRQKELGIRKVLGASVASLVGLLSRDFLQLVLIALLIAVPIAWFILQEWLQQFAYHVELQAWVFVLAGVIALSVAFLTISFQSVRAAMLNPVESLRSE